MTEHITLQARVVEELGLDVNVLMAYLTLALATV